MLRLFIDRPLAPGQTVGVRGDDLRHLRVLRLTRGDALRLIDACGVEYEAVLLVDGRHEVRVRVDAPLAVERESPLDLVLAAAILKGPRMDLVIEKATELGVRGVTPILTRYTAARSAPLERWHRIARAAAAQSGRTKVPVIESPRPLAEVLAAPPADVRVVAWERERDARVRDLPATASAAVALVGPEGGFAPEETAAVRAAGFVPISLGPRILRAETAAIVLVASCQARWGDA